MKNSDSLIINKKNVLKQKPRLLYAGINNSTVKKESGSNPVNEEHVHDFCEFLLIAEGSGEIKIGGAFFPAKKGDLIIYNKNTSHNEIFAENVKSEIMFAAIENIKLAGLDEGCLIKNSGAVIPTETYFEPLVHYFTELIKELESGQPFYENICASITNILLMLILRIAAFDYDMTFAKNSAYIEAKEYFDKNFTNIDSLDSVCKNLYINKFYLSHLFKKQSGFTPVRYLINKRIDYAKTLLKTTDLNVGEISVKCGYVDMGYFCRVFKKCEGITPLQYRYNNKQQLIKKK